MPTDLTSKMQRYKMAIQAGDVAAAERIAAERIQPLRTHAHGTIPAR